jgi:hypothetical protein
MTPLSSFSEVLDICASADTTPVAKLLYCRKSAAFALSISVRSLDYLIANKKIATQRLGRKIMITHASLVKFTRSNHYDLTSADLA